MLQSENTLELLKTIEGKNLYIHLIKQLNKDFQLANSNNRFQITILPTELKKKLTAILVHLITTKYDNYLNILYRIDVSEKELLKIKNVNLTNTMEQVVYLILKRECQKVWLKRNYTKL